MITLLALHLDDAILRDGLESVASASSLSRATLTAIRFDRWPASSRSILGIAKALGKPHPEVALMAWTWVDGELSELRCRGGLKRMNDLDPAARHKLGGNGADGRWHGGGVGQMRLPFVEAA